MDKKAKILAVASAGGHWEQLMTLRSVLDEFECCYVTTDIGLIVKEQIENYAIIKDCNQNGILKVLLCLLQSVEIVGRRRPHVVISTGAAPGLLCLFAGRLFGAKTVWIDSIANAEKLSLSGRLAGRFAKHWLTQWEYLARPEGPNYQGSVL